MDISIDQIQSELNKTALKKKSVFKNLGILAASLILFISFGLFNNSISGIILIVIVIFIHELGHLLGMKLFRYKDVQIFFIPLFGAAASGVETNISSTKKAIVALLGPLPGILLGIISGILYIVTFEEIFATAARTFLFINAFNILPFYPLDGGRFFDDILLSRNSKIEVVFKILAGIALILIAFWFRSVILGIFSFLILLTLSQTYKLATISQKLKKEMFPEEKCPLPQIPEKALATIISSLNEKIPEPQRSSSLFATHAQDIWRRVCNKPASIKASILLILCYIVFALIGVGTYIIFETIMAVHNPQTEITQQITAEGNTILMENQYISGKKYSDVQLNDKGLYHGIQIIWDTETGVVVVEGSCKDGYKDGEWKYWSPEGELKDIREYDMGVPIRYSKVINGVTEEIPRAKWPFYMKRIQKEAKKAEKFETRKK